MKLNEYYEEGSSLYENVEELTAIDANKRDEINVLVLNVVLKYLTSYLWIKETNIESIKNKVHELLGGSIMLNRGFDNMSTIMWKESSMDSFWLDCLLDLKQSSAVFKEIAFDTSFTETDVFKSLDLWSWSGILTLATYIAWLRKGIKKWEIYFVDQSKTWVERSKNILWKLSWDYQFYWKIWDITHADTYKDLPLESLSYLVSETIWDSTPSFCLDPEDWELTLFNEFDKYFVNIFTNLDPFPKVMSLLTNLSPELYQKIKKGKVWMFPNFLNKLYIPDGDNSKLLLKTWISKKLVNLGDAWMEFDSFEDLSTGQKRWK